MSILTPNMNLIQPTVGVNSGLDWENSLNSNTSILDQHNHSPGSGVQIQPSGLDINTNLSFADNSAINLKSIVFTSQLSLATTNALYSIGNDLYFNDGASNVVQITSGGVVNATSSGITSGTATASFVSSVLVVNAAANTPANIQSGSILLGNNVASSKFLTLAPPAAMAANFTLTLPALPAQTNVMTIDTSGNMSSITYNAVGQAMTATGANAVANTRTRATGTSVGVGGVAISASSGVNNISSLTYTAVPNLSVTIVTSGRPVFVGLIADGSTGTNVGQVGAATAAGAVDQIIGYFGIFSGATQISAHEVEMTVNPAPGNLLGSHIPCSAVNTLDFAAAGTYTYTLQARSNSVSPAINANVTRCKLIAYEI